MLLGGTGGYALTAHEARQPRLQNAWEVGKRTVLDTLDRYALTMRGVPVLQPASARAGAVVESTPPGTPGYRTINESYGVRYVAYPDGSIYAIEDGRWALTHVADRPAAHQAPVPLERVRVPAAMVEAVRRARGVMSAIPAFNGQVLVTGRLTLAEAAALPGVTAAAVAPQGHTADLDVTPASASSWHLRNTGSNWTYGTGTPGDDIGGLAAWQRTRGAGSVVAVVDTGVAAVPGLSGQVVAGYNYYDPAHPSDTTNPSGDPTHGTEVSAAAAGAVLDAYAAGVAPEAKVMPMVVGSGTSINIAEAAEAITDAVDAGATVVNCSFGGSPWSGMQTAMDYAASRGVVVVVAAGNDGANRDTSPMYPASYVTATSLTVGASDANDGRAYFSAFGASTVQLFAPGFGIRTDDKDGTTTYASGTSLSAPLVSGVVALMHSLEPQATGSTLRQQILSATVPSPALAGYASTGGVLNAARAVALVPDQASLTFGGVGSVTGGDPGQVTIHATAPRAPAGTLLEVGVAGMAGDGTIHPVAGTPVDDQVTADDGTVLLRDADLSALATGVDVPVALHLPAGKIALAAQLVQPDGTAFGRPAVVTLEVGAAGASPIPAPSAPATPPPGSRPAPPPTAAPAPVPAPAGAPTAAPAPAPAPSQPGGGSLPAPAPTGTTTSAPAPAPQPAHGHGGGGQGQGHGRGNGKGGQASDPASFAPAPVEPAAPAPAPTSTSTSAPASGPAPATAPSQPAAVTFPPTTNFQVTYVTSPSVSAGEVVTIYGSALPSQPSVVVGGQSAPVVYQSSTEVSFQVPSTTVSGSYDVVVWNQQYVSDTLPLQLAVSGGSGSGGAAPAGGGAPAPPPAYVAPPASVAPPPAGGPAPGGPAPVGDAVPQPGPWYAPVPAAPVAPAPAAPAPAPAGSTAPAPAPTATDGAAADSAGGPGQLSNQPLGGIFGSLTYNSWDTARCSDSCPGVEV